MELTDGELVLRPLTLGDLDDVVAACADPEIARWTLLVPTPYTEADGREFLTAVESQWRADDSEKTFALVAGGEFAGVVSVNLGDGVVGYWTEASRRGCGLMTRAVALVTRWAREQGLERLWLTTHPDNVASQRVAEKAGFRRVGVVDEPRGFKDGTTKATLYELVAPQAP